MRETGEGTGVILDCLVEFWDEFYERCTTGADLKVPYLRHDFMESEWEACARVFHFGWITFEYIPILLSDQFIRASIGKPTISIVDSFMKFVSTYERQVLASAMNNYESIDEDELIDY